MKKVWALAVIAVFCLAVVAVAGDEKMEKMGHKGMEGKVTKVDMAAKMMTVKDAAGKEVTIYWNDATKVEGGQLKEGETIHYKAAEKDGKWWASWVHVGEMHKM